MKKLQQYDWVRYCGPPLPEWNLESGDDGIILEVYDDGLHVECQFDYPDGLTAKAVGAFPLQDLEKAEYVAPIVGVLKEMQQLLQAGNQKFEVTQIQKALALEPGSDAFWQAVTSVDIWGGSGSVFDQAFARPGDERKPERMEFYKAFLQLGRSVQKARHNNRFIESATAVLQDLVYPRV